MKLRKLLSMILSLGILFSITLYCGGSVSAASAYNIYSDTNLKAVAGNTISVPVRISSNQGLMGYDLSFTFDDKVLTPVSVTRGNVLTNGFFQDDIEGATSTNNRFRVTWSHTSQSTENGIMFYLDFDVDSQAIGTTEIKVDYDKTDTYDGNFDDVTLNCSNINITIQNYEYDNSPVFTIQGTDISAGDMLNLDFYADKLGGMDSVTLTVPYDNTNFRYSGLSKNGVQATATDNGNSVSISLSGLSAANSGKIITLKLQSELFATSKTYSFSAQYSDLVGADKMLVKGTEITISSTSDSDAIVIYSNRTNTTVIGEEQLVIPLYIKHNTGLMGFTFTFNYDPSVLKIDSANMSASFKGSFFTDIDQNKNGQFTCIWFGNDDVYSNGDFLTLTFNVLTQNESSGNITITYNEKDIISEKIDGVKISTPSISYKLNKQRKYLLGDVDGNGNVDIRDVTALQRHLAEMEPIVDEYLILAADANCDGSLDISDATTIQMYLAEYPLPYSIGQSMS